MKSNALILALIIGLIPTQTYSGFFYNPFFSGLQNANGANQSEVELREMNVPDEAETEEKHSEEPASGESVESADQEKTAAATYVPEKQPEEEDSGTEFFDVESFEEDEGGQKEALVLTEQSDEMKAPPLATPATGAANVILEGPENKLHTRQRVYWQAPAALFTFALPILTYELFAWGKYTPMLDDVEKIEKMIRFSDRNRLSVAVFENIAKELKEVPLHEINEMREQVSRSGEIDPAKYMVLTVLKNLYRKHNQISLIARWKYGLKRRWEQTRGLTRSTQAKINSWYDKVLEQWKGTPEEPKKGE